MIDGASPAVEGGSVKICIFSDIFFPELLQQHVVLHY